MTFSLLQQISSRERTARLLDQPTIAKVSEIKDCARLVAFAFWYSCFVDARPR